MWPMPLIENSILQGYLEPQFMGKEIPETQEDTYGHSSQESGIPKHCPKN